MKLKTKLLHHQVEGVEQIDFFEGDALVADEMGLGKSLTSLAWVLKNEAWPCVIICPASLKWNWQQEIKTHLGSRSLVLEGRKVDVQAQYIKQHKFIILNFQILAAWLPTLRKLRPITLILDECQSISNRTSQQYHNFAKLRKRCHNFLALSGTPLTGYPSQLWPVLNFLRPDIWPSFFPYAAEHCEPERVHNKMQYRGARNLPKLHKKAKKYCMIRRLKKDVLDLPPKVRQVVPLPASNSSEYKQAEANFQKWMVKNKGLSAMVRARKSMSLAKSMHYRKLCIEAKMPAVMDWVDAFLEESDEKLIVMFCHTDPIVKMMAKYKKLAVRVDGHVTGIKRQEAIKRFSGDEKARLFIGNIQAAGTGLTLTVAHHLALAEYPWTPAECRQVEDRICRITQTETGFIYYLTIKGSVEEKIAKLIDRKDDTSNIILDAGRNEKWGVSDLIKRSR